MGAARAWLFPDKKRAPEEQNRNEPERIEQIGQVRGPIGYIIRDAWQTGKAVAQKEANDSIEDHRARDEPNGDHPGPPQPDTHAGGDIERAKQERILDSARQNASVHLQIATVAVQDKSCAISGGSVYISFHGLVPTLHTVTVIPNKIRDF